MTFKMPAAVANEQPRLETCGWNAPWRAEEKKRWEADVLHLYNFGVALDLERPETRLHLTMRELASQLL